MKKICYVCGHEIKDGESYCTVRHNSYTCNNDNCFYFYFWDSIAAKMAADKYHHFVIVNKNVYEIGSDMDYPRGFSGRHWIIQFNDGIQIETNSLWYRGKLPERLQNNFKDNAKFIK